MQDLLPIDGGPIYAETDLSAFIVEPWNAVSSLAIMLPAAYWAFKLKWKFSSYPFLYFLIPLLFLGGTGSMLYHGFRSSQLLLWMDVLPTAIVTLAVGIYFWHLTLPRKWQVVSVVAPIAFFRIFTYTYFSGQFAINLSYVISGFLIFFPIIFYLIRHQYRHFKPILFSVLFLSLSLLFRRIDNSATALLPMGSHFLWHILSGFGAYYLAAYIYLIRKDQLSTPEI